MELNKKTLRNLILGAMGCILLYWLLHETDRVSQLFAVAGKLVKPFVVGACIAFILNVPMRAIERRLKFIANDKLKRFAAMLLTVVILALVLTGVVNLLIPQIQATIVTIGQQLPGFFSRVEEQVQDFLNSNPQILLWLTENTDFENFNWANFVQQVIDFAGTGMTKLLNGTVSAVGSIASGVIDAVIGMVFGIYCLANKETLARQGRKLAYTFLPERAADQTIRVLRLTNSTFSNFISGQCIEVIILGCLFAVCMTIFKMPYVSLVSVLVAVTAFVPVVGAFTGCILGAFFILVNDPMQAVWFVIMFLVLQQIENNLIYPRVVGTSIGLPSMWVLVAVTIGGDTMGVAGMLLMIPLSSVVYTLLREYCAKRVTEKNIDSDKLKEQPPELRSRLKEKREQVKRKREAKRAERLAELMKEKLHIPEGKNKPK